MHATVIPLQIFNAVKRGMRTIARAQQTPSRHGTEIKDDQTIVTPVDKQVEAIIGEELRKVPNVRIWGEEGTRFGEGHDIIMFDPLDGTRPFAVRAATSTVIVTEITNEGIVKYVLVGDPATGRIWTAAANSDISTHCVLAYGREAVDYECRVWKGPLSRQSVVFTDHSQGFKREHGTRQILTDEQVRRLLCQIPQQATLLMLGSNGMHMALVANGSEFASGSITTAVGGPWDIAGVLLVLRAGGTAQGIRVTPDRRFVMVDPLHVTEIDIMVTGNSQATVSALVTMVESCL